MERALILTLTAVLCATSVTVETAGSRSGFKIPFQKKRKNTASQPASPQTLRRPDKPFPPLEEMGAVPLPGLDRDIVDRLYALSPLKNEPPNLDKSKWKPGVVQTSLRSWVDALPPPALPFRLEKPPVGGFPGPESDLLFYLHLPKTAGQSFHRVLCRTFNNCSLLDDDCLQNTVDFENRVAVSRRLDWTYAGRTSYRHYMHHPAELPAAFVSAVVGLGHTDASIALAMKRPTLFVTFLRDPVKRIFSWFNYMKSNVESVVICLRALRDGRMWFHPEKKHRTTGLALPESEDLALQRMCTDNMNHKRLHDFKTEEAFTGMQRQRYNLGLEYTDYSGEAWVMGPHSLPPDVTAVEFLGTLPKLQMDNIQVRSLAGVTSASLVASSAQPQTPAETLQLAKDMLSKTPFFGIVERFEDSIKLYLWTFGFPMEEDQWDAVVQQLKYNKSKRKFHTELDEEIASEMEWMDHELYRYGLELFGRRIAEMERQLALAPAQPGQPAGVHAPNGQGGSHGDL